MKAMRFDYYMRGCHGEEKITLSQALDIAESNEMDRVEAKKTLHDPNNGMLEFENMEVWSEEAMHH